MIRASVPWCFGSRLGDHRGDENAHREKAGDDEEQGQLHVPGAGQVVGKPLGDARCRKPRRLRRGSGHSRRPAVPGPETAPPRPGSTRRSFVGNGVRTTVPGSLRITLCPRSAGSLCQPSQAYRPKRKKTAPGSAEQGHQTQSAPQDGLPVGRLAGQRLFGPVVRVRVVLAGPRRRTDPGGPGEIAGQVPHLLRIPNVRPLQPLLLVRRPEPTVVVVRQNPPGMDLSRRVRDRVGSADSRCCASSPVGLAAR